MTRRAAPSTIRSFSFHASQSGPSLLIFGAIHGNEICGTLAIRKIMAQLESGELSLVTGCVTFVPIANPLAHQQGVRYVKDNLNRIFKPTKKPRSDEARFANILCGLVDHCDVFLDIHSITAQGKPFLYIDFPTTRNRRWAKVINVQHGLAGWPQLYEKIGLSAAASTTIDYAANQGKDCLLIECGQHHDPAASKVAYNAILATLQHYGLVAGATKSYAYPIYRMKAAFFRKHADDRLAQEWKHLDPVRKGQSLVVAADGSFIKAPYDGFIIMPKASAPVGDDWLYLGTSS